MAKETPAQKQSRARILWEKDSLSHPEIAERVGVSPRTIANWAERGLPNPLKGPWEKGSLARKVQEKREEGMLEAAKRRGMDDDYFASKLHTLLEARNNKGQPNLDAIDKGLTHAERIIPRLKAQESVAVDFPAEMLAFFQGHS
jgi:transposase